MSISMQFYTTAFVVLTLGSWVGAFTPRIIDKSELPSDVSKPAATPIEPKLLATEARSTLSTQKLQVGDKLDWMTFLTQDGNVTISSSTDFVGQDAIIISRHSYNVTARDGSVILPAWFSSLLGLFRLGNTTEEQRKHDRINTYFADPQVANEQWKPTLPQNFRIVFMTYNTTATPKAIEDMKLHVQHELAALGSTAVQYWSDRIYFVEGDSVWGDLRRVLQDWGGPSAVAVDVFGAWREVGSLFDWDTYQFQLEYLRHTVRHFNFEKVRYDFMQAVERASSAPPLRLTAISSNGQPSANIDVAMSFPELEVALSQGVTYDTMHVEASFTCPESHIRNCPRWDRKARLFHCNEANDDINNHPTSCYEITRWTTSYHRQGVWVTDASFFLPLIYKYSVRDRHDVLPANAAKVASIANTPYDIIAQMNGGYLHFNTWDALVVELKFVLTNQRKQRFPISIDYLWKGGDFGPTYSNSKANITIHPSEFANDFELAVWVTGHGWGTTQEDCAEFCPSQHIFAVNNDFQNSRKYELANGGTDTGCRNLVDFGVLPNQYGSWPYGRAGWCPGWNVRFWHSNIRALVPSAPSSANPTRQFNLSYRGYLHDHPYVPTPPEKPNGMGFGPQIELRSYLVQWYSLAHPTPNPQTDNDDKGLKSGLTPVVIIGLVVLGVTVVLLLVMFVPSLRSLKDRLSGLLGYSRLSVNVDSELDDMSDLR